MAKLELWTRTFSMNLSQKDMEILRTLRSKPLVSLTQSEQKRAMKLYIREELPIEQYTISFNPYLYTLLPCKYRLHFFVIDPMLLLAERRILDYLTNGKYSHRLTLYSISGEFAFAGFFVGREDEATELAEQIYDSVHKGVDPITPNPEVCDLREGLCLYTVINSLRLSGETVKPLRYDRTKKRHKRDISQLVKAVHDASEFNPEDSFLKRLKSQGLVGPFTIVTDPIALKRFSIFIPVFHVDTERLLKEELLSDPKIKKQIWDLYELRSHGAWNHDPYTGVRFLLFCEFEDLYTDYNEWYGRLVQKLKQANINEFIVRSRLKRARLELSPIAALQELSTRYGELSNTKKYLNVGSAIIEGDTEPGGRIVLSRAALARHLLVLGLPRQGKSTTLRQIASESLKLGLSVILIDGKGDLVDKHLRVKSSKLKRHAPIVLKAKDVVADTNLLKIPGGTLAIVSVKYYSESRYPELFNAVIDFVKAQPLVTSPRKRDTRIQRVIILDELETLTGNQFAPMNKLVTALNQAASHGSCIVPVCHSYPTGHPGLVNRCENRILHRLPLTEDQWKSLLPVVSTEEDFYNIDDELENLNPGNALVSFTDESGVRLSPLKVQIHDE